MGKMNFTLDTSSKIPLYQQLTQQLILEMAKGNLQNGDQLPSIRNMAMQTKVNLHTVHKSYRELQRKGLIALKPKTKAFILTGHSTSTKDNKLHQISFNLEQILMEAYVMGLSKEQLQQIFNRILQKYSI